MTKTDISSFVKLLGELAEPVNEQTVGLKTDFIYVYVPGDGGGWFHVESYDGVVMDIIENMECTHAIRAGKLEEFFDLFLKVSNN